jgi:hypothetical protein
MAEYKYDSYLTKSTDSRFDTEHSPGVAAPYPGIYRCIACGDEIGIAKDHTLPPQNHRQHQQNATIKWKLLVMAVQK